MSAGRMEAARTLVARAAAMLTRPSRTWETIAGEQIPAAELYRSYVAPLAAVPAVCSAIGLLVFRISVLGVVVRLPASSVLAEAVAGFLLSLAEVYALAVVIDMAAPAFGGLRSRSEALKLSAYSGTAVWVAGAFAIIPALREAALLLGGLASLGLLFIGLPKLMQPDPEQRLSYFAVVLLAALFLAIVYVTVTSRIGDMGGPLSMAAAPPQAWPT